MPLIVSNSLFSKEISKHKKKSFKIDEPEFLQRFSVRYYFYFLIYF